MSYIEGFNVKSIDIEMDVSKKRGKHIHNLSMNHSLVNMDRLIINKENDITILFYLWWHYLNVFK